MSTPRHSGVYLPDSPLSSSALSDDSANQPLSLFNSLAHNGSFACALAAKAALLKKVQEAPEVSKVQDGGAHPIPTRVQQHRRPPLKLALCRGLNPVSVLDNTDGDQPPACKQNVSLVVSLDAEDNDSLRMRKKHTPGGGGGWLHNSNDNKPAAEGYTGKLPYYHPSRSKPVPVPTAQSPSSTPLTHVTFIVQMPANMPAAASSAPGPAVPTPTAPPAEPTAPPSAPSGRAPPRNRADGWAHASEVREAGGGGGMPRDEHGVQRGAGGGKRMQHARDAPRMARKSGFKARECERGNRIHGVICESSEKRIFTATIGEIEYAETWKMSEELDEVFCIQVNEMEVEIC
ncbi:hypothetical protein FB451DRAFT_1367136 [Mycena latifolia]|nr:hypothetical protein FB451DRAFT_1367136 [Mycena latifolia]